MSQTEALQEELIALSAENEKHKMILIIKIIDHVSYSCGGIGIGRNGCKTYEKLANEILSVKDETDKLIKLLEKYQ